MTSETPRRRSARRRSRAHRRFGGAVRLAGALMLAGLLYTLIAPGHSLAAAQDAPLSEEAQLGEDIFQVSCATCHGPTAQGVEGRGPSLIGVGGAAVEFQVTTGRMPLARQGAQAEPKPPVWGGEELERNTEALAAYIQALGGGPQVPASLPSGVAAGGGELYRINCSSCHAYPGGGGALSGGSAAPPVVNATDRQIWAAMLSGPQNMPVFGDNEITPEEKADIIAYINTLADDGDPGGIFNLGRFGPATEGLAIFLVGIVAMVLSTLWIAGKS